MKVLSLLLFFFHFMKMRPLIGGINAVSLVNMHKVWLQVSELQADSGKKCFPKQDHAEPSFSWRALARVSRHHVWTCWRGGISGSSPDLLCSSVSEQSLQVMHMSQGLGSSCRRALCVPSQKFSSMTLASQFSRLHGWHLDISICGWQEWRGAGLWCVLLLHDSHTEEQVLPTWVTVRKVTP